MGLRVACLVVLALSSGGAVAGCGDSSSFRFGNGSLDVTTTSPPLGARGQAYTTTLTASGGRPRYAWALRAGALPAGLALDGATGVISGTPTTAGDIGRFTVRVIDADGFVADRDLVLGVRKEMSVTNGSPLPGARLGAPYLTQLQSSGGTAPITWDVASGTTLPPGFSLNRLVGQLVGIPTQRGTFTLTLVATDTQNEAGQASATMTFQLTVS